MRPTTYIDYSCSSAAQRCSLCYQLIWKLLAKQCNRINSDLIAQQLWRTIDCSAHYTHMNISNKCSAVCWDEHRWRSLLIPKSINIYRGCWAGEGSSRPSVIKQSIKRKIWKPAHGKKKQNQQTDKDWLHISSSCQRAGQELNNA